MLKFGDPAGLAGTSLSIPHIRQFVKRFLKKNFSSNCTKFFRHFWAKCRKKIFRKKCLTKCGKGARIENSALGVCARAAALILCLLIFWTAIIKHGYSTKRAAGSQLLEYRETKSLQSEVIKSIKKVQNGYRFLEPVVASAPNRPFVKMHKKGAEILASSKSPKICCYFCAFR